MSIISESESLSVLAANRCELWADSTVEFISRFARQLAAVSSVAADKIIQTCRIKSAALPIAELLPDIETWTCFGGKFTVAMYCRALKLGFQLIDELS